ncbi:MAG TPA: hypothetical protein VFW53_02780 [Gallionella sp.]|nr:hypothetical protein [Gallionella sp.]
MRRDKASDEHERRTCSITAASVIDGAGGASVYGPSTVAHDAKQSVSAGKMRAIPFAISLLSIVLAFNSGPTFLAMIFVLVSIACFGYGFGSIMNSPPPSLNERDR